MTNTSGKINLLGLTQPEMEQFFESIGEKRFRAGQVMKWIHHFGVDDFAAMTNVGKALREKLEASAEIRGPEVVSENISADGTRKWVVRVASGSCVETVYIPQNGRGTLCVSSQAGCALDCSFCSTGKQGHDKFTPSRMAHVVVLTSHKRSDLLRTHRVGHTLEPQLAIVAKALVPDRRHIWRRIIFIRINWYNS